MKRLTVLTLVSFAFAACQEATGPTELGAPAFAISDALPDGQMVCLPGPVVSCVSIDFIQYTLKVGGVGHFITMGGHTELAPGIVDLVFTYEHLIQPDPDNPVDISGTVQPHFCTVAGSGLLSCRGTFTNWPLFAGGPLTNGDFSITYDPSLPPGIPVDQLNGVRVLGMEAIDSDGGTVGGCGQGFSGTGYLGDCVPAAVVPVTVDIKPGSDPNSWSCKKVNDAIPVALLSTMDFDATTVDANSVRFGKDGGETGEFHRKNGAAKRHVEDVNKDGLQDMVFHFRFGDTGFSCADISDGEKSANLTGTLTGETQDGTAIEGEDNLRLVRE